MPLSDESRTTLLNLAVAAVRAALMETPLPETPDAGEELRRPAGAFVTLRVGGELRGCVGIIEPQYSLAETVTRAGVAAALKDARFPEIQPDELASLSVEISILSPLEPITPDAVELGRHGLVVQRGESRGLLLPQVAIEHSLTREQFLAETCRKAGLPRDAWRDPETHILAFTAEIIG